MSDLANAPRNVVREVGKVVAGKDVYIKKVMLAILAGGHILMDDIPGVGKTTMALAFSKAMALKQKRVQFTPDVLPSDVTGFYMFQKETKTFRYMPGPVMTNLFLADEINRTSPKTQSALLQVMEEGKVTIDGNTLDVPEPFIVIATQNPVGSAGTQLLPESQLDRFMICFSLGYPDIKNEIQIIKRRHADNPLDHVRPVMDSAILLSCQKAVEQVYIHDAVYEYIAQLVNASRNNELIKLGVSPRGTLALCRMAMSSAFLAGRDYVLPDDVAGIFKDVAGHRIVLDARAGIAGYDAHTVLDRIIASVPKPVPR